MRDGQTRLEDVPAPALTPNGVLVQTRASLISAGTERMIVEFAQGSLLAKARAQPDKVRQVLDKIKADGLLPTLEAVFNKLDEPLPLGYCNAGVVLEVGSNVTAFRPGDRVASNGPHAELVAVPANLCARIPDAVSNEQAAFTVLSAIGLQGVRLLMPTLGETVVVYGLGLIGLVTVQLLRASGCRVIGVDLNPRRLALAEQLGAAVVNPASGDVAAACAALAGGEGADGVLITASAKTDEIIHASAQMCRKRGRIVLVGVIGLNLRRSDFYEKELTFQVSCSYGPGRYDPAYEERGQDYPLPFVRWSEQRNFQAVLDQLRAGALRVDDLITHRLEHARADQAYQLVRSDSSVLGLVLQYPAEVSRDNRLALPATRPAAGGESCTIGVIGAGSYCKATFMPALARTRAKIAYVADLKGANAAHLARKHGAANAVTDYRQILADGSVDAVAVTLTHDLHARFICEALAAGKHVFVEKPLCLSTDELRQVLDAAQAAPDKMIMVGFNRRFSPHTQWIKQRLQGRSQPLAMTMTINAGHLPPDHWTQDPHKGGGRIIGEGCHFIDLMTHLAGSPVRRVFAQAMGASVQTPEDKMSISLAFEDGSIGTIHYLANGAKAYPKETLEVFSDGRVFRLDNFRRTTAYGQPGSFKTWRQDKGHAREVLEFTERVRGGGEWLIPLEELVNVTLASFAAVTSAREGRAIELGQEYGRTIAPPQAVE